MLITIDKSNLKVALQTATRILPLTANAAQQLISISHEEGRDFLILRSSTDGIKMETRVLVKSIENDTSVDNLLFDGKMAKAIAESITEDIIRIDLRSKDQMIFRSGSEGWATIPVIPYDGSVQMIEENSEEGAFFVTDAEKLCQGIDSSLQFIKMKFGDSPEKILIEGEEDSLNIVGTNGQGLSVYTIKEPGKYDFNFKTAIPACSASAFRRAVPETEEPIDVKIEKNRILFTAYLKKKSETFMHYECEVTTVSESYPNYKKLFLTGATAEIITKAETFQETIRRCIAIGKRTSPTIKMTLNLGETSPSVTVRCVSGEPDKPVLLTEDIRFHTDDVEALPEINGESICFNPDIIREGFSLFGEDTVKMKLSGRNKPVLLESANRKCALLPSRG